MRRLSKKSGLLACIAALWLAVSGPAGANENAPRNSGAYKARHAGVIVKGLRAHRARRGVDILIDSMAVSTNAASKQREPPPEERADKARAAGESPAAAKPQEVAKQPESARPQEAAKIIEAPKGAPSAHGGAGDVDNSGVKQFCTNVSASAADARLAWESKRIAVLEQELKTKTDELTAKTAELNVWVAKREAFLKKADDTIVAIYTRMKPESASAQIQVMDDSTAAALLTKLNPRTASTILNEMEPTRAAKLTDLMSNGGRSEEDGKS